MARHRNPNYAESFRRKGLPMARKPSNVPPPYPKKPHNGQARITVRAADGRRKDLVLGPHGSPESLAEYRRVLAELGAHGGLYPVQATAPAAADLTVNELLLQYWHWAEEHYRDPEGNPTRELENLKDALRPLRPLYGHTQAKGFGPSSLRAVQQEMVKAGLCRSVVNSRVNRVRRLFKWAASFELVPVAVHQALQTVLGLRRGHGKVREAGPIKPAADEHVNATVPFLPAPVRAMVELQRLTACRAGEVMVMRAIDLSMTGPVWTYRPRRHKNQHRGMDRIIFLGPQAQEIVKPFLTIDLEAFLFSPRAYVEALHRSRAEQRKTKRTPSELKRKRKATPRRVPAERYSRRSYRVAVVRGCDKATRSRVFDLLKGLAESGKLALPEGLTAQALFRRVSQLTPERVQAIASANGLEAEVERLRVPHWSPLQLRHTAATAIRARYGIEAAKVVLGHTKVETSQIYAERDLGKAQEIMREIG
jgi:integrase